MPSPPATNASSARQPAAAVTGDESFDAPVLPRKKERRTQGITPLQSLMGVCIAGLVVTGTVAFFAVDVCEEELSDGGSAVTVCRHLEGTDPPVIAFGVVLLAMLSVFFSEISGFGVTLKRQVEELKETSDATRVAVARNQEAASEASQHAADAGQKILALRRDSAGSRSAEALQEAPPDPIRALADRYNEIRLTMPSGTRRTTVMTGVVTDLIAAFGDVRDFDVLSHLQSGDRGLRLAGYAYLYAYPDPRFSAALADTVIDREDKPFGQYWGLRALRRQCESLPSALDANTRRRLELELRPTLPIGTDRQVELAAVLNACQ